MPTSLLELDSNIPYNIFIRNLKSLKAGQVVVNFDIILEKNRIIFHGSRDDSKIRTVRGKVRLEVAGKLNVKEIILSLVEKQGTVFSSSILLENKRVLLSGIHEFHFEFLLPGDLSESMNSDAVLCKYFLKAELMTRFPSELSTDNNKSVDIVDLFIERAFLESDDDITNGLRPTRFIGGNNDLLDFEFILPKIMKLNSNSIEFIGRWSGFNRVDKISFCFVQSECYNIANNGCIVHNEKSIAGPFCFQLPKNEPLRLQSRPTIFKLPICESFVNDYDLVNIKIRHQLDVKIQLNNFKKDQIEFSIPISVKSIIPNQDTLPLPHKIDLSNSVACLQLGNEIYTSLTKEELKVPLLSSYISEQTAYHHGEDNLHDTIIGLAQNFVGSNNINLLELIGQFGARKDGDKRNAAPGSHPLLG
ncbi:19669_t:CDS:2 [Entrophospora sp. SA101]|nr:19669_t:CDS:2 [Entrophospora sp. SA101]